MVEKKRTRGISLQAGRREILDIIKACKAVEERKVNPFLMDVGRAIETLRRYFPRWRDMEDHCLDAQTLSELSKIIKLQESQLRFQSSLLYADPDLLEYKFKRLPAKKLADLFLKSWHPIVELERLTNGAIDEALEYWNDLLPVAERWKRFDMGSPLSPSAATLDNLLRLGLIAKEDFERTLTRFWEELKHEARGSKLDYWKFVSRESFQETVKRAYLVSFLVTHGYASMFTENSKIYLMPNESQLQLGEESMSFPISIRRS
jgi:hypothetical protein